MSEEEISKEIAKHFKHRQSTKLSENNKYLNNDDKKEAKNGKR